MKAIPSVKALKKEGGPGGPAPWKISDFEKAKASMGSFKRSFKLDKPESSLKSSLKVGGTVPSERPSNEVSGVDATSSASRFHPPSRGEFSLEDRKVPGVPRRPDALHGKATEHSGVSSIAQSGRQTPANERVTKSTVVQCAETDEHQPQVLGEFLERIDKKFASLRQIFGSESKALNRRQFSFFLSKLGWIGELDKNFDVQREEDEQLVAVLFEGMCPDGAADAPFPVVRSLLATVLALFEKRLYPRGFELKEKVLSARMTPLSNKKTDLSPGPKLPVVADQDASAKPSIARVQSCNSTPTQLAKYSSKFEGLSKPVAFPTTEGDMQFSFRKASDQKLRPLPEPGSLHPLGLEYVDATHLNSNKKVKPQPAKEPDSNFLHSEEKTGEPPGRPSASPGLLGVDHKNSFDFGMSICESRVIENDAEASIERNFAQLGRPSEQSRSMPVCELSIKIDNHCEILRLFEGDDLRKIAHDFVRKWNVPEKELLVFQGLTEAYEANLPRPKKD